MFGVVVSAWCDGYFPSVGWACFVSWEIIFVCQLISVLVFVLLQLLLSVAFLTWLQEAQDRTSVMWLITIVVISRILASMLVVMKSLTWSSSWLFIAEDLLEVGWSDELDTTVAYDLFLGLFAVLTWLESSLHCLEHAAWLRLQFAHLSTVALQSWWRCCPEHLRQTCALVQFQAEWPGFWHLKHCRTRCSGSALNVWYPMRTPWLMACLYARRSQVVSLTIDVGVFVFLLNILLTSVRPADLSCSTR